MISSIIDFIEARLAEDEAAARATLIDVNGSGDWRADEHPVALTVDLYRVRDVNIMHDVIMDIHGEEQVKKDRSAKLQAGRKSQLVYYMRIGNRVKIGTTTNLKVRLEAINPEELLCTEPGGHPLEKQRHRQFAEFRTHGEWFRLQGELQAHIDQLRSQTPSLDDPLTSCNTWG